MEKVSKKDWSEYYKITKNKLPSKLLVCALEYAEGKDKAIDIGGGALKDTRYLLEQGFDVVVVDSSELMEKEAKKISSDKLHYFASSFANFNFPENTFDLASAQFSLPFNPPESFKAVLKKIKLSLKKDGIFCGQLFGVRDGWANRPNMTFHTMQQAQKLFKDMEVIYFNEEEKDGETANGTSKHWHIFHFIAKKI